MPMLDDIYNTKILELAGNIPRIGRLADPDASARAHSRLCGSTVTVDLKMADGRVSDFAHDVKACALGQASSSIMARNVVGSTPDELRGVARGDVRMLKENGAAAGRALGRPQIPRAGARLPGAPRLDAADLRRGGRRGGPDRSAEGAVGADARLRGDQLGCAWPALMRCPGAARARPDPRLPLHAVEPRRPHLPASADLLGIRRRARSPASGCGAAAGWGSPASGAAGRSAPTASIRCRRACLASARWYRPWRYGRWGSSLAD